VVDVSQLGKKFFGRKSGTNLSHLRACNKNKKNVTKRRKKKKKRGKLCSLKGLEKLNLCKLGRGSVVTSVQKKKILCPDNMEGVKSFLLPKGDFGVVTRERGEEKERIEKQDIGVRIA